MILRTSVQTCSILYETSGKTDVTHLFLSFWRGKTDVAEDPPQGLPCIVIYLVAQQPISISMLCVMIQLQVYDSNSYHYALLLLLRTAILRMSPRSVYMRAYFAPMTQDLMPWPFKVCPTSHMTSISDLFHVLGQVDRVLCALQKLLCVTWHNNTLWPLRLSPTERVTDWKCYKL